MTVATTKMTTIATETIELGAHDVLWAGLSEPLSRPFCSRWEKEASRNGRRWRGRSGGRSDCYDAWPIKNGFMGQILFGDLRLLTNRYTTTFVFKLQPVTC